MKSELTDSPHQLYTTVSLRLGKVHDLRTRSSGDLSLDDISSLRRDLENLSREIVSQMTDVHDPGQRLAFMSSSIFPEIKVVSQTDLKLLSSSGRRDSCESLKGERRVDHPKYTAPGEITQSPAKMSQILYGLVQGRERPLEMIELVDAISEVSIGKS